MLFSILEFFFGHFLKESFSAQDINLEGAVFEDDIALFIAAEFPGFNEEDVVFADPQAPFQASGDSADAGLSVHAAYFHTGAANALFADAQDLPSSRDGCSSDFFFLLLLLRCRFFFLAHLFSEKPEVGL